MLGPQQGQLLHVEKDDQVIQHNNNNNKTWETKEKIIRNAFLLEKLVKNSYNYGILTFTSSKFECDFCLKILPFKSRLTRHKKNLSKATVIKIK
jgi:hypothetical protein